MRTRQILQVSQIVDNRRNCCQICCHITPYLRSEEEGPAMHFIPNCTHCPGLLACLTAKVQTRTSAISIIREIFAGSWGVICASGSVRVHRSMGASYWKAVVLLIWIRLLPRLPPLLLNGMEFAGTAASLFCLFNNCHRSAASQGVGRYALE